MNFVAIFSAYFFAGCFLAAHITRSTLILFPALYTVVALLPAAANFSVLLAGIELGTELSNRVAQSGENASLLVSILSGGSGEFLKYSNPLLQLLAYIGSVAFVFQTRARKAENVA